MNKARPLKIDINEHLPEDYKQLGFQDRLIWMEGLTAELRSLQNILDDLRTEESTDTLHQQARSIPDLPTITAKTTGQFRGQTSKVLSLCFANQNGGVDSAEAGEFAGQSVVSVSQDAMVVAWDVETGAKTDVFKVSRGHNIAISATPTGRVVALGGLHCTIDIYSVNDRFRDLCGIQSPKYPMSLKHDAQIQNESARMFCGVTGDIDNSESIEDQNYSSFADDGKQAQAQANANTRHQEHRGDNYIGTLPGHATPVFCCLFSEESQLISGAADGTVAFWDVPSSQLIRTYNEHCGCVTELSSNPSNHRQAVSAGDDGVVKLWDIRQKKSAVYFQVDKQPVMGVKFLKEGHSVLAAGDFGLKVLDLRTSAQLSHMEVPSAVSALECSPSGRLAFVGQTNGKVAMFDILKGTLISEFSCHRSRISTMAVSNDTLSTGSWDGIVKTWKFK